MNATNATNQQTRSDVSRRALSIARMIDRLPPGKYVLNLKMPESESERWTIEVVQPVTIIQTREVFDKSQDQINQGDNNHGKPN